VSKKDWGTLSLLATMGGAVVAWHGYANSRGWTDAHRLFVVLAIIAAVGPHLQDR